MTQEYDVVRLKDEVPELHLTTLQPNSIQRLKWIKQYLDIQSSRHININQPSRAYAWSEFQ